MGLLTLQDRRERGDVITMHNIVNNKTNTQNLILMKGNGTIWMRGHSKKIDSFKGHQEVYFPHRTVYVSNRLSKEIITATNIQIFKEKLDDYTFGALLKPCNVQIDKYD